MMETRIKDVTSLKVEYRPPTVDEYKKLREAVKWWKTDENSTCMALKNSLFSVVIIIHDSVIGFGRIIGDGLYFYIQDLIVHPNFQSEGIGKILMNELMNYIYLNAKKGAFIGLMAANGLEKYYEKFGFRSRDRNAPGMFKIIN